MIRRPPRSTLFPYTRSSDLVPVADVDRAQVRRANVAERREQRAVLDHAVVDAVRRADHELARSEEHTSELQSRRDLVCRLLLEKKKEKIPTDKLEYTLSSRH